MVAIFGSSPIPSHRIKSGSSAIYGIGNSAEMKVMPATAPGPDNDLADKLAHYVERATADADARMYAFGERWGPVEDNPDKIFGFQPGNGVHDIHMNQGNSGQFVRDDGPTSHHTKRGTPTMGGAVIVAATLVAYGMAHVVFWSTPSWSGVLVLFLMAGLGLVGFLDDYIKIFKQRSLGLRARTKFAGQTVTALVFGVLALNFRNHHGLTPASDRISFIRDTIIVLGPVVTVIWIYLMVAASSNGVNLTDGLDGLATGASVMTFAAVWLFPFPDKSRLTRSSLSPCTF